MSLRSNITPCFNNLPIFDIKSASNNTFGYFSITLFLPVSTKHFGNPFIGVTEEDKVQTVFFLKPLVGLDTVGRYTYYSNTVIFQHIEVIPKIARFGGTPGSVILWVEVKNYLFIPKLVEAKFLFLTIFVDTF